jgi:predicted amidophosphoribosyltransferase
MPLLWVDRVPAHRQGEEDQMKVICPFCSKTAEHCEVVMCPYCKNEFKIAARKYGYKFERKGSEGEETASSD